uniref:phospholipase A2 n=1 Tax=Globodera pallida TaxID=36090 RepID=A0A183BNU9_GLOPA
MFAGGVGNATAARALLEERRADRDGCTPLLCAVKRNDLDAALQLLAYGADPHRADANGDTPLHHAVMASSVQIVKLLLCFGANLNVPNNAGQTANSLKIKDRQLADEIISRARMWMQHGVCSAGHNSSSKGDSKRDVAIARVAREQQHLALLYQQHRTTTLSGDGGDRMSSNALRLLSLDGGGIRGLVLIQMLMEIERLMDDSTKTKHQKEKGNFVQRHFDWIAGTSTGAILALALADGTPLLDCLRLYLRLKDDVFGPQAKASRFGGYKPECIEQFLQEHFGGQRKMADLRCGKMKVFVTATKAEQIPIELVLFRNYNSPFAASDKHAPGKVRIWQAARYSSAAPTYFASMDGLMDGGLIANNPSNELLREVYLHNEAAQLNIVSLGNPILKPLQLI